MRSVWRLCPRSIRRLPRTKRAVVIGFGVIALVYVIVATDVISDVRGFRRPSGFLYRYDASPDQTYGFDNNNINNNNNNLTNHHPLLASAIFRNRSGSDWTQHRPHSPDSLHHQQHHNGSIRINGTGDFPSSRNSLLLGRTGHEPPNNNNSSSSSSRNNIILTNTGGDTGAHSLQKVEVVVERKPNTIGDTQLRDEQGGGGENDANEKTKKDHRSPSSSGSLDAHSEGRGGGGGGERRKGGGGGGNSGDGEVLLKEGNRVSTTAHPSVLLAGVPKDNKVFLTIGMVTVKREKADYFFSTMESLLQRSSPEEQREITIVVMLGDRDQSHNDLKLRQIQERFPRQLEVGLLLVIRGPNTDFIFSRTDLKRTFDDSLTRVQWRSKQNVDYAAVMEYCTPLSSFYLHLEDDVIAAESYLRHIRDFIRLNAKKLWAMLEVCPHGFIGKLFKNADLPKLVMILRSFYLEQPCDFLINYFTQMMTQPKRIVRSGNLFFHQGKFSSLTNQTRKTDKLNGNQASKDNHRVAKVARNQGNPAAEVTSNMTMYQTHLAPKAYNLQTTDFTWALDIKEGDRYTVVFTTVQKLQRLSIRTGFSNENLKDSLQNGRVEMGTEEPHPSIPLLCPGAKTVGQFEKGQFDVTLKPPHDIKCFSIVITAKQDQWLIIREIVVTSA